MKKRKKNQGPPDSVRTARLLGDREALSRLGRYGARVKEEMKELDRRRETADAMLFGRSIKFHVLCSYHMMRRAHEHICPID